ncbi:methyltransferase domain-containing protein [archaeon]|nr:methyltransferase domain-containing protein [archaeon]
MDRLKELYNYSAKEYNNYMQRTGNILLQKLILEKITKFLDTNESLIDIGTGTGNIIYFLKKRIKSKKILGVDFSYKMIKIANKKTNASFMLTDANNLPFRDFSFDNVLCSYCFSFFEDVNAVIKEMTRICKKRIILIDKEIIYNHIPRTEMGKYWHRVNYKRVRKLIESYGFKSIRIEVRKNDTIFAIVFDRE